MGPFSLLVSLFDYGRYLYLNCLQVNWCKSMCVFWPIFSLLLYMCRFWPIFPLLLYMCRFWPICPLLLYMCRFWPICPLLLDLCRFWRVSMAGHRQGPDERTAAAHVCGHTVLDGTRSYGAGHCFFLRQLCTI